MRIVRCNSPACGRPFQLNQFRFSADVYLPWERGKIVCPHCGAQTTGDADLVFLTHALSTTQEEEFRRQAGGGKHTRQDGIPPAAEGDARPDRY